MGNYSLEGVKQLTDKEKELIQAYITCTLTRMALRHDLSRLHRANLKFIDAYTIILKDTIKRVTETLNEVLREMIFIKLTEHHDLYWQFVIRGLIHEFTLTKDQANKLVKSAIDAYIGI